MSKTKLSPKDQKRLKQCLAAYKKKKGKHTNKVLTCMANIINEKNTQLNAAKIRAEILKITSKTQFAAIESVSHYTYWYTNNLESFYLDTTSNPGLSTGADIAKRASGSLFSAGSKSIGKSTFKGIAKYLTKNALSKAATVAIAEKIAAEAFKTFAHVALAWTGGIALDVVLVFIFDSLLPNQTDIAVLKNNAQIKKFCQGLRDQMKTQIDTKIAEVKAEFNNIDATIGKIQDAKILQAMKTMAQAELSKMQKKLKEIEQKSKSKALYAELLSNWVKENAGDDNDDPAKNGPNQAQWDAAVKKLQGLDSNKDSTDDKFDLADKTYHQLFHGTVHKLTGQADTCAFQLSKKLEAIGLDKNHKVLKKMHADLGKLNFNADNFKNNPTGLQQKKDAVKAAEKNVEKLEFSFDYKDIKQHAKLANFLNTSLSGSDLTIVTHYLEGHRTYANHATKGFSSFNIKIQLDINEDEGSLMVLKYKFALNAVARSSFLSGDTFAKTWKENSDDGIKK